MVTSPEHCLTLCDLQRIVRSTLEERFPIPVWISAEISELKVNYSGHCYLDLVEKGDSDGVPRASARAVIWRSAYGRISERFRSQTGEDLSAGIHILAAAAVSYHEVYGFSLQIVDIDPTYTMGQVERRRRETIRRLQTDGVWDMNRETEMPRFIGRIAVISSAAAAGYRDFMREIEASPYALHVELFDACMQGGAAEQAVVEALEAIAAREEDFDAVAIIRGGGSTSDLAAFDSYRMASHIAQFPLPVISGIGHDKDTSVVDMVAHTALKTPTAAAVWIVERMAAEEARLDTASAQIRHCAIASLHESRLRLEHASSELHRSAVASVVGAAARMESYAQRIVDAARQTLLSERRRLQAAEQIALSRSTDNILRLGFAVVRIDGKAVASLEDIGAGAQLDIELSEGRIEAEVSASVRRPNDPS